MAGDGIRDFYEQMGAHARRKTARPNVAMIGEIQSYSATDGTVVVKVTRGDTPQPIGPMPLMVPWLGPGYGDQGGPEEGVEVVVLVVDDGQGGNEYIALGFIPNDDDTPPAAPSKVRKIVDALGSGLTLDPTQRGGLVEIMAAAILVLQGATKTYVGGDNLDDSLDAVITKRDLDAALAQIKTDLTTWATTKIPVGSGNPGPTTMTTTSTGSSKVKVAP